MMSCVLSWVICALGRTPRYVILFTHVEVRAVVQGLGSGMGGRLIVERNSVAVACTVISIIR